ncbi:hypothetical protein EVAR_62160_1 [Eumeta japonica]|uniref:Uncharacterized protein n=1 Tax=Eumeta variegata TaxID=151549 RepID=A0A4C1ZQ50_EUMVA|nr:hypothetical protein EVAR_62160_1 [Eumeta japonica]
MACKHTLRRYHSYRSDGTFHSRGRAEVRWVLPTAVSCYVREGNVMMRFMCSSRRHRVEGSFCTRRRHRSHFGVESGNIHVACRYYVAGVSKSPFAKTYASLSEIMYIKTWQPRG